MRDITLIPIDARVEAALAEGVSEFEVQFGATVGGDVALIRDVVLRTLAMPAAPAPFGGYLAATTDRSRVIGACAFVGQPDDTGAVEIAYFTFPSNERQGYATAMAGALVRIASEHPAVRALVAHTLPADNVSTRVLTRLGFERSGEAVDDEAGTVWRWSLAPRRSSTDGGR
jgi:RimJ/RimL family protein N-acetyltransferase